MNCGTVMREEFLLYFSINGVSCKDYTLLEV